MWLVRQIQRTKSPCSLIRSAGAQASSWRLGLPRPWPSLSPTSSSSLPSLPLFHRDTMAKALALYTQGFRCEWWRRFIKASSSPIQLPNKCLGLGKKLKAQQGTEVLSIRFNGDCSPCGGKGERTHSKVAQGEGKMWKENM